MHVSHNHTITRSHRTWHIVYSIQHIARLLLVCSGHLLFVEELHILLTVLRLLSDQCATHLASVLQLREQERCVCGGERERERERGCNKKHIVSFLNLILINITTTTTIIIIIIIIIIMNEYHSMNIVYYLYQWLDAALDQFS